MIKADCEITSWPCVKQKVHNPQVSCQTNGEHVSQQHSNTANFMDAEMEDKWLMTITMKEDEEFRNGLAVQTCHVKSAISSVKWNGRGGSKDSKEHYEK